MMMAGVIVGGLGLIFNLVVLGKKKYSGNYGNTLMWYYFLACKYRGRSQGQIFTEENVLIASPVGNVVKRNLWRPNMLSVFNLGC